MPDLLAINSDLTGVTVDIDPDTVNLLQIQRAMEVARCFYKSHIWARASILGKPVNLKGYLDVVTRVINRSQDEILEDFKLAHSMELINIYTDPDRGLCIREGAKKEMIIQMKKYAWFFLAILVALCFTGMFFMGMKQAKARNMELKNIRGASEIAVINYFNNSITAPVNFPDIPICYSENKWIDECYIDLTDDNGVKHRTGFDVAIWRENQLWKASIIKVYNNQPVPKEIKKIAPWDFLFKSAKKGR